MINNIKTNQINDFIDNGIKFYSSNILGSNPVNDNLPILIIFLRCGKNSRQTLNSVLTFLWDSVSNDSMIKCKHINTYISKLRYNTVKYIAYDGPNKTTNDVKVPFIMPEFSRRNL